MSVRELFNLAVHGRTKDERKTAYRELRRVSLYGEPEEAAEARYALEHSAEYLNMEKKAA